MEGFYPPVSYVQLKASHGGVLVDSRGSGWKSLGVPLREPQCVWAPEPFSSEPYAGVFSKPCVSGTGQAGTVRCYAIGPEDAGHHSHLLRM